MFTLFSSANSIINTIGPFVLPTIMIILSVVASGVCIYYAIKILRRQIKLNNSITLVELKSPKMHYYIFAFVIAFFIIYTVFQMIDGNSPEVKLLQEKLAMERWQTNLALSFLVVLLTSVAFMLVVLGKSKSAVVDRGVYASLRFLDWYHVHDYIIDEKKGIVILSSNKETFSTLKGTTTPLKVSKNDIAKLKFILNKNKNKFSGFSGDTYTKDYTTKTN